MDERPAWHPIQFVFIAFAITGGSPFTFLYLLYKYSASSLVPYYFFLIGLFVPTIFIQLKLGGSIGSGAVGIFSKYLPVIKGAGVALMIRLAVWSLIYATLIAQAIYFLHSSFSTPYPWSSCNNTWNTINCGKIPSQPSNTSLQRKIYRSPSEEFYWLKVLEIWPQISPPGPVVPHLGGCLVGAWLLICLVIVGGRRWAGFTISVLSAMNLVLVLALMAYGWANLRQHANFHWLYASPDYNILREEPVWLNMFARLTHVHTLSGALPMMGKSLGPGKIITHTSWIFIFLVLVVTPHLYSNCLYPYLAAMAVKLNVPFHQVMHGGSALYFIVMPDAFSSLGLPKGLVVIFFFFVILQLLLSVSISAVTIQDSIQGGLKKLIKNQMVLSAIISVGFCGLGFLFSLLLVTHGGFFYFLVLDSWFDKMFGLTILVVAVAYIISILKHKFHVIFKIVAAVILAVVTLVSAGLLLTHSFKDRGALLERLSADSTYVSVPIWMKVLTWLLLLSPLILGMVSGVVHMVITRQPFAGRTRDTSSGEGYLVPADREFDMGDMKPR